MEESPLGAEEFDNAPASTDFGPESRARRDKRRLVESRRRVDKEAGKHRTASSMDHFAFLPLNLCETVEGSDKPTLNEMVARKVRISRWQNRCLHSWTDRYGEALVTEDREYAVVLAAGRRALLQYVAGCYPLCSYRLEFSFTRSSGA